MQPDIWVSFYTVLSPYRPSRCPAGGPVPPLDWTPGLTCWPEGPSYEEAVRPPLSRAGPSDTETRTTQTTSGLCTQIMMKFVLCSLLSCLSLLLSDVLATYTHLSAADPQLVAAQSFAQTRNNGRPPLRTLNPASKSY